ncbi:hypothetical protein YB2330_002409 [Saitoella coloradoensis]
MGWKGVSMSKPIEGMVQVKALERTFKFSNFSTVFAFMTRVAFYSEKHNHHPQWNNSGGWNKVTITWTTDDAGGAVTEKDLMAAKRCSKYAAQMGEVTPATADETDPSTAFGGNMPTRGLPRSAADSGHGRSVTTSKRQEPVMPPPATEDTTGKADPADPKASATPNQSPPVQQHAPKPNAPKLLNHSASRERIDRVFGLLDDMKKTYGNERNDGPAITPRAIKSDTSKDTKA